MVHHPNMESKQECEIWHFLEDRYLDDILINKAEICRMKYHNEKPQQPWHGWKQYSDLVTTNFKSYSFCLATQYFIEQGQIKLIWAEKVKECLRE